MTTAEVETSARRWDLAALLRPAALLRSVLTLGLGVFLVVYIGLGEAGATVLKVLAAVGISAAVFVGANKLFDLAYGTWTLFCTLAGLAVGFPTFLVLDGNRVLRDLDPQPWAWAVIGGVAVSAVMFALSAPREQLARLPLAVAGFAGLGVLVAVAVNDDYQPSLDWAKVIVCTAIGAALFGGARLVSSAGRRNHAVAVNGAILGAALGWLGGAWGGAEFASVADAESGAMTGGGNLAQALVATVIPLAALGFRVGSAGEPTPSERREIEQRSRSWIFVTPALLFVAAGLLIPLIRTIYISFKDRQSTEFVGLDNYRQVFEDDNFYNVSNWSNMFTSRLFWAAVIVAAIGVGVGIANGRRTRRTFESGPATTVSITLGFFLAACAVLSSLRGTLFNNLWWVVVVTALATTFGLAVAVLADRSKGENVAKSLIFLPMAISFVGAGVIWRFMYIPRDRSKPQTGLLNAIWVGLGELSNSDWQKWLVGAIIALLIAGLAALARQGITTHNGTRAGFAIGVALVMGYLLYRLLGPGLGGFEVTDEGEVRAQTILFTQETPFNNMWLMVVLIWIQTGFAMVIFSSAIKAVPSELTEAAKIDGATESQVFWKVTIPQIAPTVGVVVTTLIVTVMKVFDIVKVMTGGQLGTQVVANQMFEAISSQQNFGLGATLATVLFVAIVPVMYYNIRRMQQERG